MKIRPDWISGFVDGEGTFYVGFNKAQDMKTGVQVLPEFRIVQHRRDIKVLYALKDFFKAGVVRRNHGDRYELRIRKLEQLDKIIVPFFINHPLHTQKKFDFIKFKKIIKMMVEKKHLEKDGIVQMIDIASKMNRNNKQLSLNLKKKLQNG